MITSVVQRWRGARASYRPVGEPIRPRDYEIAAIIDDNPAKRFIVEHHYSASYPAARFRFGLYRLHELVGVAVFSQPVNDSALSMLPGEREERCELGRFVLLDAIPANGETWFLARAFELLRAGGMLGVLSFSDPLPRADSWGLTVFRGHIGTIYQASNAVYAGRGTARTLRVFSDGKVFSARTIQKIRARERGFLHAAELLIERGASVPGSDSRAWLREWLPRLTRTIRHPGNHRYLFGLTKQARRYLPAPRPYPKFEVAA